MQCPMCIRPLLESYRHHTGVELDVCPTCRGAWLDRGELEALLVTSRDTPETMAHRVPSALISDHEHGHPDRSPDESRFRSRKRRIFHDVKEFFD